ncbi:molybdate ABC transporter permease subunit [Pararcticibacter amylolyticus]|uniref:Molybdenum transport system permease n=1 Tax=Pararcticibacter amylolyticus TaxID=2173175 RepID=A0A2U2PIP2_9SPHI|nr:molybdate ABC transporter permease subunit [Pararcticibacter amylolyticus]PWG81276.1 molybdate ABC transporter permease subunit [Pararcticibacter amylolyticus]
MDWLPILLSMKLAGITTLILFFIGLPVAWWLSEKNSVFSVIVEAVITMPLVLPPSVLGFYLLLAFSPQQSLGKWLQETFDISLVFSFKGLVIASVIYSLPFMISPLKSAFMHLPKSISQASYTMGKSKFQTLWYVLLPNIKPAMLTAAVLTFAHTLGEFGVVLMIGGNIPGVTKVASIAIYDSVESMDYQLAHYYSLVLFALTFIIVITVFILNRRLGKSPLE